jgi:hypothetical protein
VDPRGDLDGMEDLKILGSTRTRTPAPRVVQPVASRYTDCTTAALYFEISVGNYLTLCRYSPLWNLTVLIAPDIEMRC